ncbi:MAG: hypothetical protein ACYC65_01535 [Candidatus Limnocylindrales bacterium]
MPAEVDAMDNEMLRFEIAAIVPAWRVLEAAVRRAGYGWRAEAVGRHRSADVDVRWWADAETPGDARTLLPESVRRPND